MAEVDFDALSNAAAEVRTNRVPTKISGIARRPVLGSVDLVSRSGPSLQTVGRRLSLMLTLIGCHGHYRAITGCSWSKSSLHGARASPSEYELLSSY
jgi:hypothetical protein